MVEEAGAVITDQNGGNDILKGNIIAGSPDIHQFLLDFVRKKGI